MAKKDEKKLKNPPTAPTKSGLPATIDFSRDSGIGFDHADTDSYMIPFLVILQTNSPQCMEGDPLYVKGAKPGFFYNTATKEIYDGKAGIFVLQAAFQPKMVEWVPRDQGGGFRGIHEKKELIEKAYPRDISGRWTLPNGNYLADVRYHFLLQITPAGPRTVVLGLTSTQLRPSREWMTALHTRKVKDEKGREKLAPTMSLLTRLTTVDKSNEKGRWKLLKVEIERFIDSKKEEEAKYYFLAKEFYKQVEAGTAKPETPTDFQDGVEEEGPF